MRSNTVKAKERLLSGNYTCVVTNGENILVSTERGVKPLLAWLDDKVDLTDYCAADKVVGKAAAFLYVLLGVKEIYASVISKASAEVLESHGIACSYDLIVDAIRNRANTGFCPMEQAVKDIELPDDALDTIRRTAQRLSVK